MRDDNCIFCKIANGDVPTNSIYEDDDFRVILDASPATKGHSLIIPKEHYKDMYEIDEKVAAKAMSLAKKLTVHMTDKLGCDGFNILQNNREVAGQTVFHFHMHLIPRYNNDDARMGWKVHDITDEEIAALVAKFK